MRITENADTMFADLNERLLELRDENLLTEEEVKNHIEKYKKLFHALDGIWSNVRGVECGLLPTEENLEYLGPCDCERQRTLVGTEYYNHPTQVASCLSMATC